MSKRKRARGQNSKPKVEIVEVTIEEKQAQAQRREQYEKAVKEIIALKDSARAGFTRHRQDFIALEDGYENIIPDAQNQSLLERGKSNLNPNMIKPRVAKIAKEIIKTFFSQDELVRLIPPEGEENSKLEEALQAEIKEYARDNNLYAKMYSTARDGLIYGTSVLKSYWRDNTFKIELVSLRDVFFDKSETTKE